MSQLFFDRLSRGPLVCDGGMGTQLMARGMGPGVCGETWNTDRPADVAAVHRDYRDAGCDLLTTNTFRGCSTALAGHGLADRVVELNLAGARNAKTVADEVADAMARPFVMGDIGPFGDFLEPMGDTTPQQLREIFRQQVQALAQGGVDGVIIETMSDANEVAEAIAAAKAVRPDWPVIATYAFERGIDGTSFHTMMGLTPADAVRKTFEAGADVVGTNCGTSLSLEDYLRLAEQIMAAAKALGASCDQRIIVQPNAGAPVQVDGKLIHPASPADMATLAVKLRDVGVRIIGGCCGTTPAHLRAMASAIRAGA